MKNNLFIYLLLMVLTVGSVGCTKDNYEPPKSQMTGRVVYNGQPIGVRSNGVQLELWQHGYAFFSKIPVYVAQDGSFSALLFDGNYKMTRQNGVGPWVNNTDSLDVKVSGNTIVDMPVTPYSIVKSATPKEWYEHHCNCQHRNRNNYKSFGSCTFICFPYRFGG